MSPIPQTPGGEHATRIESHSVDVVPLAERHGRLASLGAVWFVSNLNPTAMAIGIVVLTLGGTLFWSLAAMILGSAVGTIFMALHSTQGAHLGLPQMIQSRAQFGYVGAAVTVFLLAFVNYLAYNTMDAMLVSDAVNTLTGLPVSLGYVLAVVIAASIALFGYDMIHKVSRLLVFPTLCVMGVMTVGVLTLDGITPALLTPGSFDVAAFMTAFVVTAGFQLGWAPYVSDYSRYLPASTSPRKLFWWTYIPSASSAIWVFVIGALAQIGTNSKTPVAAFMGAGDAVYPGAGRVVVCGLLVTLLVVMAINQYGGSLTLLSIADSIKPIESTRMKRAAAIVLMAMMVWTIAHTVGEARFNEFYSNALIYLAYAFTPWTAINLTDYFVIRRGNYAVSDLLDPSGGIYGRWNWRGNVVYAATLTIMVPFMVTSQFVGVLAQRIDNVDLSLPVGLAAGTMLYLAVSKVRDRGAQPASDVPRRQRDSKFWPSPCNGDSAIPALSTPADYQHHLAVAVVNSSSNEIENTQPGRQAVGSVQAVEMACCSSRQLNLALGLQGQDRASDWVTHHSIPYADPVAVDSSSEIVDNRRGGHSTIGMVRARRKGEPTRSVGTGHLTP
jgi:nucleobase:cation symporter-1, NCS1 family